MRVTLEYAGTPPSYNRTIHAHWRKSQKVKRQWQGLFEGLLMASPLPRLAWGEPEVHRFILAQALLRFPTRRRRDEDNYKTMIAKPLGDALTNGNWLYDDTPEFFRMGAVYIEPMPGPSRTGIFLEVVERGVVGVHDGGAERRQREA